MVQASAQQLELVLVQEWVQEWVLQQVLAVREREQVPQQGLEQEQEPERVRRQTHRRPQ
jgi:hypothetical protein